MANTLAYYDTATITAVKSFIVQAPGVNFIKLFCRNLHRKQCNPNQNLRQYADSGGNYAENSFMKLATVG